MVPWNYRRYKILRGVHEFCAVRYDFIGVRARGTKGERTDVVLSLLLCLVFLSNSLGVGKRSEFVHGGQRGSALI